MLYHIPDGGFGCTVRLLIVSVKITMTIRLDIVALDKKLHSMGLSSCISFAQPVLTFLEIECFTGPFQWLV